MNAGPVTSLNYTTLHRPAVQESGNDGSRLMLSSQTYDSLRSSIGMKGNWNAPLASGASISVASQLTWDHELMNNHLVQQAAFANYRSTGFNSINQVTGRDALGIKAGMSYKINADAELGIGIESEFSRSGYNSIAGNLSATWRF